MSRNLKRVAYLGFGSVLMSVLSLSAVAQNQPSSSQSQSGSSLGDYARQIRKDGPAPAKARPKVYDNDNLPAGDKLSVIGEASQATTAQTGSESQAAAASASTAPGAQPKTPEQEAAEKKAAVAKQWQDKISAQKDSVDLLGRELDVTQREYQLRAAAMYADAGNRMRNEAEWDKQDAQYKQQIADKQKALDDAKAKLDDIQENARKAGSDQPAAPAAASPAPAAPAPPQ
ncbi:MAG TPA: hypothetical protein VIW68_13425 [Candidatus Sulfotelmatobacter sp.]